MKKTILFLIMILVVGVQAYAGPPAIPPVVKHSSDSTLGFGVSFDNGLTYKFRVNSDGSTTMVGSNHNPLISNLTRGLDSSTVCTGDSTSDGVGEWFELLAHSIGNLYPNYHIQYYDYHDDIYDSGGMVIQDGTNGESYLYFTGSMGAYMADSAIADFAGNPDIRVKILPNDWTPSSSMCLCAHGDAGDLSFRFFLTTTGALLYMWTEDGSTQRTSTSSTTISDPGAATWVRVTHNLSTDVVQFWTSADGITWSQLGSDRSVTATGSIHASSGNLYAGCYTMNVNPFSGRIYSVQIYDGIGSWPVLNRQELSEWSRYSAATCYAEGGPTLRMFNGSVAGSDMEYCEAGLSTILPEKYRLVTAFINYGHNAGLTWDATVMAEYTSLGAAIRSASDFIDVIFMTQNPELSPRSAGYILANNNRNMQMLTYIPENGYKIIDVFSAFSEAGAWDTISDDGLHPDLDAHATIWEPMVRQWLISAVPQN
jgi:hypothetical protein